MDFNNIKKKFIEIVQLLSAKLDDSLKSERERRAIFIGIAAVIILVLFVSFNTFLKDSSRYQKQTTVLENELKRVKVLREEYGLLKDRLRELTKAVKKENEALISVLEKVLIDNDIERTSFSIKDSKIVLPDSDDLYDDSTVEVNVRKVPFNKVVDILYSIQNRDSFLKVSDLRLKTKFDKPELVDVSFKLSTFEFRQDV
jgi:type II secretory pathway component PulM